MATAISLTPPLESGDRLTRAEFHRRYCAHPEIRRAELVEGVVYVASPLNLDRHGEPHGFIITWAGVYLAKAPGIRLGDNSTVYLDADNEHQPDLCLVRAQPRAGEGRVREDGYVEGPPPLIVEVAASSAAYDLHDKLRAYRRAGVQEYVVWQVYERRIVWFRLHEGAYTEVQPDSNDVIESTAFPGLRLHIPAMLAGDLATVLATLQ